MARGDVTVFDEAKAYMLDGDFGSSDFIKCAILDNTTTPTAAFATPALGDFTEVGDSGTYVLGGTIIGTIATCVSETNGIMTYDSAVNPTWAQNASNDVDAYWGLIYNDTDAGDRAIAFVELDGPVDMTAGPLTITWSVTGIFTIT